MARFSTFAGQLLHETTKTLFTASISEKIDWQNYPIYHYCDVNALTGIICKNTLWATDLMYMNDYSEYIYGRSIIAKIYHEVFEESKSETVKALLSTLNDFLGKDSQRMDEKHYSHSCCCCFCLKPDKLSQWRAYAADGYGYAVGFDTTKLLDCFRDEDNPRGSPYCVIYDVEKQESVIRESIVFTMDEIQSKMTEKEVKNDINSILAFLYILVNTTSTAIKHPAFTEEEELRYVINERQQDNREFRTRGGLIIPFKKLTPQYDQELPVKQIIVGPCLNFDKARFGFDVYPVFCSIG